MATCGQPRVTSWETVSRAARQDVAGEGAIGERPVAGIVEAMPQPDQHCASFAPFALR